MTDIVTPETRSRMMAGIRDKNTKPELSIRKLLHGKGFRYRLHDRKLPGKPDIVLPRYSAVILIHGCFWHGHDCHLFRLPSTRTDFWKTKIDRNRHNDSSAIDSLSKSGWRVATVWECALRGKFRLEDALIADSLAVWIRSTDMFLELLGTSSY